MRVCSIARDRRRPRPARPLPRRLCDVLAPLLPYALDGLVLLLLPAVLLLALIGWFLEPPAVRDDWPDD